MCNINGCCIPYWLPYLSKVAASILAHSLGSRALLMSACGRRLEGMASKVRGDRPGRHATCAATPKRCHYVSSKSLALVICTTAQGPPQHSQLVAQSDSRTTQHLLQSPVTSLLYSSIWTWQVARKPQKLGILCYSPFS